MTEKPITAMGRDELIRALDEAVKALRCLEAEREHVEEVWRVFDASPAVLLAAKDLADAHLELWRYAEGPSIPDRAGLTRLQVKVAGKRVVYINALRAAAEGKS